MAYAFLKGLRLDGDIGTLNLDLKANKGKTSKGHELVSARNGEFQIKSARYPFCEKGDLSSDDSIRSGATLVPFNKELNRLMLRVRNGHASNYKVTWGSEMRNYTAQQLKEGINLAEDYPVNPFSEPFRKVDETVAIKQEYETKQIKQIFHDLVNGNYKSEADIKGKEIKDLFALRDAQGKLDMDQIAAATEKQRQRLVEAVQAAFVPVTHTIRIEPQE